jgi:hypothetical protein
MVATNDFLTFGTGAGANVLSQAAYAALAARLSGYESGLAQSVQMNKTWRQSSIIASMIAQFISDVLTVNVTDDGTIPTIESNFELAIKQLVDTAHYGIDTGPVNALQVSLTPSLTPSGSGITDYAPGTLVFAKVANTNTGPATLTVTGLSFSSTRNIVSLANSPLVANQILANSVAAFVYDGANFQLQNPSPIVGGVLTGTLPNPGLKNTGVNPGTFANATVTVGFDGRITTISAGGAANTPLAGGAFNSGFPNISATATFTPVFDGILMVNGTGAQQAGAVLTASLSSTGTGFINGYGNSTAGAMSNMTTSGIIGTVKKGTPVVITFMMTGTGAFNANTNIGFNYICVPTF